MVASDGEEPAPAAAPVATAAAAAPVPTETATSPAVSIDTGDAEVWGEVRDEPFYGPEYYAWRSKKITKIVAGGVLGVVSLSSLYAGGLMLVMADACFADDGCDDTRRTGWIGLGVGAATGIGSLVVLTNGLGMHWDHEASKPMARALQRPTTIRSAPHFTLGVVPDPQGAQFRLGVSF